MKRLLLLLAFPLVILGQTTKPLTLEQSIATALKNNYGIIIQKKNLEISHTSNSWGAVGALPSIDLSGSATRSENYNDLDDFSTQTYSGTMRLNWVLFRGFGAFIDKSKLDEMEKLSQGNLAVIVENTISNVILSYYGVLLQEENMILAETLMMLSKDRYESEKLKVELGSSVTYNLLQAKTAYLEDKSNYLAARANYNNAMRQLNYLMAEPLEKRYDFLSTFSADTTHFDKSVLLEAMLADNNTLKNQYTNLELAKLDVRSARSSFFPTITASATGGYSDSETKYSSNSMMNNTSSGFNTSISLGVSFTLLDGGTKRQSLKIAKLDQEIAEVETEEMVAELKNQLFQEYEYYQVRIEMLRLADENLKAAKLNLKISQEKFETGAINSFNLRDVQQLYLSTALSRLNAIYDVIESYHSLLRLTGGLIGEYR